MLLAGDQLRRRRTRGRFAISSLLGVSVVTLVYAIPSMYVNKTHGEGLGLIREGFLELRKAVVAE